MNKYAYKMPYVPLNKNTSGNKTPPKNSEPLLFERQASEILRITELEKRLVRTERICAAGVMLCMERNGLTYDALSKDIDEIINNL